MGRESATLSEDELVDTFRVRLKAANMQVEDLIKVEDWCQANGSSVSNLIELVSITDSPRVEQLEWGHETRGR